MFTLNRKYIICIAAIAILFSCSSDKENINPNNNSNIKVREKQDIKSKEINSNDLTDEILHDIGNRLSGSWMYDFDEIDGVRKVSWGTVPISNRSYFIIDFFNNNKTFIKGASEGGKLGVDSIISKNLKIEPVEVNVYRFIYNDTLDTFNPGREQEIVIRYYPEEDALAIVEYYGNKTGNSPKMIRISEPIESP